jgi:hypothetical protein
MNYIINTKLISLKIKTYFNSYLKFNNPELFLVIYLIISKLLLIKYIRNNITLVRNIKNN